MSDARIATMVAVTLFVVYNANGREIASYDSQPTKYAAREFLLRGTLSLNHVVGQIPELGKRSGFVRVSDGRIRSAYSPVPALIAATMAWPFWKTGLLDVRAPLAPSLIAAVTASTLVAAAVALLYLAVRRLLPVRQALLVAGGIGVGTGLWSTASQTLWQHETAIFGFALASYGLMASREPHSWLRATLVGLGTGLALSSRLQLAPAALMLIAGVFMISGRGHGILAATSALAIVLPVLTTNYTWFGHLLGAAPLLEAMHGTVHSRSGSFAWRADGALGLLVSPNRGLLVFSPVMAVAILGMKRAFAGDLHAPAAWLTAAALAQFVLYASYTVWWGGHTYGPRYLLDILPLLVPAAAFGLQQIHGPLRISIASVALAWSILVAATGAFFHPHGQWNSVPYDVDRTYARIWDLSDLQIQRCVSSGPSPQNFSLFSPAAVRVSER